MTSDGLTAARRLVRQLFEMARENKPSIIFIDEIDSFLKERSSGDHEVTGMMKAEFMTYVAIHIFIFHSLL